MPMRRILVVDHDEDVLLRLEHLLETAGFETTVAWRLDEVRHRLDRDSFDLLVIGHHPPSLDAGRVLQLANGSQRPPCIVLHPPQSVFRATPNISIPWARTQYCQSGARKWQNASASCFRRQLSAGNQRRPTGVCAQSATHRVRLL
jgi:CheY-like chemotaxis protein